MLFLVFFTFIHKRKTAEVEHFENSLGTQRILNFKEKVFLQTSDSSEITGYGDTDKATPASTLFYYVIQYLEKANCV